MDRRLDLSAPVPRDRLGGPMPRLTLTRQPDAPPAPQGPTVIAIMDGVGRGPGDAGDAVHLARTPHLDALVKDGVELLQW